MKWRSLHYPGTALLALAVVVGWKAAAQSPAGAPAPERPGVEVRQSGFVVRFDKGAITSLKREGDVHDTDYIAAGSRFGDLEIRWRTPGGPWQECTTRALARDGRLSGAAEDPEAGATWDGGGVRIIVRYRFEPGESMLWTFTLTNTLPEAVEVGDLAIPCPMNSKYEWDRETTYHRRVIRHSLVAGAGSFLFWMRCNAQGPFLAMTPCPGTGLEYFDPGDDARGYTVYLHSAGQDEILRQHGTQWRQARTSLTLASAGRDGCSVSYAFRFGWPADYDAMRSRLVDQGLFDVRIAPGMTVPTDLRARIAVRTQNAIRRLAPEFPDRTRVRELSRRQDGTRVYEVEFQKPGENLLTVETRDGRRMPLEFFVTEPLETLIGKRAAFLARSQHRNPSKWYDGLITDWNMRDQVLVSPDNLDRIPESRRYAVSCDDPGLCKAPFLAAKNCEYPNRAEIEALEYYIEHFVWGGLQMTDAESHPFAIYGIQDWKRNRDSADPGTKGRLHLWRIYDYPHVVMLYLHMYRIARDYPHLVERLPAAEYLRRAHGTAIALFTYPLQLVNWSPYQTGLYNEVVLPEVIAELIRAGQPDKASSLRDHWEKKVEFFLGGRANLFASEYPFDSTGFESTHAFARYALRDSDGAARGPWAARSEDVRRFSAQQLAVNIGARGWLETAYYLYGSDYRAGGNSRYTLSYMSAMGGWSILDSALHDADDPYAFLPLGYASILSSWALMNTGPPGNGFGYWFPGPKNDGAAGGGFEPAPYGRTWLGQPHSRGSWYYGCEIDLGFGGALRALATVFADDPLFGPMAYGGLAERKGKHWHVFCRDGVRRRFHIFRPGQRLHLELSRDHFAAEIPVRFDDKLQTLQFTVESPVEGAHTTGLTASGLPAGRYQLAVDGRDPQVFNSQQGKPLNLPIPMTGKRHQIRIRHAPLN